MLIQQLPQKIVIFVEEYNLIGCDRYSIVFIIIIIIIIELWMVLLHIHICDLLKYMLVCILIKFKMTLLNDWKDTYERDENKIVSLHSLKVFILEMSTICLLFVYVLNTYIFRKWLCYSTLVNLSFTINSDNLLVLDELKTYLHCSFSFKQSTIYCIAYLEMPLGRKLWVWKLESCPKYLDIEQPGGGEGVLPLSKPTPSSPKLSNRIYPEQIMMAQIEFY